MAEKDTIKLISLNIERDQHYDTALPFLKAEQADIICLQEVLDRDVPRFKKELQMDGLFMPTAIANKGRGTEALAKAGIKNGNALFTSLSIADICLLSYCDCGDETVTLESRHFHKQCIYARVMKGGASFVIATTHFTWTPDGQPNDEQRRDIQALLQILKPFPELILCGDFNAPRGGEIWEKLAARYTDNIPPEYKTSIDQKLHKVPGIMYVIDGLWSTPEYHVSDVHLVSGVSDHMAVVGFVEKR